MTARVLGIPKQTLSTWGRLAEKGELQGRLFRRLPTVRQLVADVWQDEHTTGARPPIEHYTVFNEDEGLYTGPIDGWFSIYHRSILPMLLKLPMTQYYPLGAAVRARLAQQRQHGVLDRGMKKFHVIGPEHAAAFGMLQFEIEKYRRLGRRDIVDWYEGHALKGSPAERAQRIAAIQSSFQ